MDKVADACLGNQGWLLCKNFWGYFPKRGVANIQPDRRILVDRGESLSLGLADMPNTVLDFTCTA